MYCHNRFLARFSVVSGAHVKPAQLAERTIPRRWTDMLSIHAWLEVRS